MGCAEEPKEEMIKIELRYGDGDGEAAIVGRL